jgi:hypothetical protein
MSLQSITTLGSSPLHAGGGDESSSEETLRSSALRCLMWLSSQSRLAISFSLCYSLRVARRLSAADWLRLKITTSGRGTFAGTR